MRRLAIAAALIAAVVDAFYLGAMTFQPMNPGGGQYLRIPFVAAFIAVLAVAAAVSVRESVARIRPGLLALSASGLLAMGFVALFSIGLPLMIAGALALAACILSITRSPRPAGALLGLGGLLVATVVFVGGLDITDRAIACPPNGYMGGSGYGFLFTGAYHYSCANGKLSIKKGFCSGGGATMDPTGKVVSVSDC